MCLRLLARAAIGYNLFPLTEIRVCFQMRVLNSAEGTHAAVLHLQARFACSHGD